MGDFECNNNELTTLEGGPKKVDGNFYCYENNLTSFEGAPEEVGGTFDGSSNPLLTTFENCPKRIGGKFECRGKNKVTSPAYIPYIESKKLNLNIDKSIIDTEQEIMKKAKTYEDGVQAYQEYLDIFGDE